MSAQPQPRPRPAGAFRSVVDMWCHRVDSTPRSLALRYRDGARWRDLSWAEADVRVRQIAHGLLARGLEPEQRVAILARTSVPWILADLGILSAAGATTTVYPTSSSDETQHVLAHSGARFVFCDDERQVAKVQALRDALPALEGIVVFDGEATDDGFVTTLAELEERGRAWAESHPEALDTVRASIGPDSLATLIYTSGTTGLPKGVMLSHDAWVYEGEAIDGLRIISPADLQLLFLPLAHVFAKVMQILTIRLGVPTAVDHQPDRLLDTLAEVQPTWLAGVPRVFEKARNRILGEIHDAGVVPRAVFRRALAVAAKVRAADREGRTVRVSDRVQYMAADRWLFAPIRERFGGRLRFMVSGGAPLSKDVATFFDAIGMVICEGYGLTESAAASCVNTPEDVVFGTVGRPVPGCEVRIADDGEVLLRSRGVMQGYFDDPEATAEALSADGWLHTGDIGRMEPSGHLRITDRKKNLIVTAGGKNVAPTQFERLLKAACPQVGNVLVHGDGRNFCTALVTLDPEAITSWAHNEGLGAFDAEALAKRSEVRDLVSLAVDDVNATLSPHERVQRFAILPEPFTVASGLLTPSMKMKRKEIEARYAEVLDRFYDGAIRSL